MSALTTHTVVAACAALLALAGCQPRDQPEPRAALAIAVRARTPQGDPVADVRAWADGRDLGVTRVDGELAAQLEGREGQRVRLTFACPADHRTLEPSRTLALRAAQPLAARAAPVPLLVRCTPIEHVAALVVRARGARVAGLPVRVQGEAAGRIEADGSAHLLIPVRARSALRVALDTSSAPNLRPANPVQTFALGDEDRVLLFDQTFTTARRRTRVQVPLAQRPYRID